MTANRKWAKLRTLPPRVHLAEMRTALPSPKRKDGIYYTAEYRAWRAAVMARAGHRCQHMGCGRGGRLIADHVTELSDGGAPFDVGNGQALCPEHHAQKTAQARVERMRR